MVKRSLALGLALAGGLACPLMAQTVTLTDGNATMQIVGPFNSNLPNCNLVLEPGGPDHVAQLGWYYRTQNNNQNSFFSNFANPLIAGSGNSVTMTWTNNGAGPVGVERFNATLTITLTDGPGPDQGLVEQVLVFQAAPANASQRQYQVFNVIDLDLDGVAASNNLFVSSPAGVLAGQNRAGSNTTGEILGVGANLFEANTGSALRTKMNGGSGNFNNTANFTGDAALGLQWSPLLNPGEQVTIRSVFAINRSVQPAACYANCDGSTAAPVLNALDFSCFLSRYVAGESYANCDGSTAAPVLNALDFSCFLSRYVAGCP